MKGKKIKVKVIPTEVYSRIVGYFRPVQNWNRGKVEEFRQRRTFDPSKIELKDVNKGFHRG